MSVKVRATPRRAAIPPVESPRLTVHPRYRAKLAERGLHSAESLLDLPGEIVSGHPDRHVARVELPGWGCALYLKRQHRVGVKERFRQWYDGFGWVSRCGREAQLLRELDAAGFACPQWVASGEDACGRAFLLVEELADTVELRHFLSDSTLSPHERQRLAERLGREVAELHSAGFDTPDLTAKHVFVNPHTFAVTLIDWQSARRVSHLSTANRLRSLAAFHASLGEELASPTERIRFLWAYRRASSMVSREPQASAPRWVAAQHVARRIESLAARQRTRRSIRDQRQSVVTAVPQRLVWLAGEAVCAVPDVAAIWPTPAIAAPFYDDSAPLPPLHIQLPDGRPADLLRGRSFAPFGRFQAWLRAKPWRSPGVTAGRVLFHLQRYGIPAPQLFAFGQRETGCMSAEWFALSEPPAGCPLAAWLAQPAPLALRREVCTQAGRLLRQLHDAGCRPTGYGPLFRVADHPAVRVSVSDGQAVRVVKRITTRARRADLFALLREQPGTQADQLRIAHGYYTGTAPERT